MPPSRNSLGVWVCWMVMVIALAAWASSQVGQFLDWIDGLPAGRQALVIGLILAAASVGGGLLLVAAQRLHGLVTRRQSPDAADAEWLSIEVENACIGSAGQRIIDGSKDAKTSISLLIHVVNRSPDKKATLAFTLVDPLTKTRIPAAVAFDYVLYKIAVIKMPPFNRLIPPLVIGPQEQQSGHVFFISELSPEAVPLKQLVAYDTISKLTWTVNLTEGVELPNDLIKPAYRAVSFVGSAPKERF